MNSIIIVPDSVVQSLYSIKDSVNIDTFKDTYGYQDTILPAFNQTEMGGYLTFQGTSTKSSIVCLRFNKDLVPIKLPTEVMGIKPRSLEQKIALHALLEDDIKLLTLYGKAGTGKTLISLAAAYHLVMHSKNFKRIILTKPRTQVTDGEEAMGEVPGPQPLDAKILTPSGWTTMGKLEVGQLVIDRNGNPTKVLNIYPKGEKEVFKLITTDGRSTECCADHLWFTRTIQDRKHGKPGTVKTTQTLIETLTKKGKEKLNHFLPRVEAVEFNNTKLPIPSYTLGALLGDGSLSNSISLSSHYLDIEVPRRVEEEIKELGCTLSFPKTTNNLSHYVTSHPYNNKPARPVRLTNIETKEVITFDSLGLLTKAFPEIHRATLANRCENQITINNFYYEFLPCPVSFTNSLKEELHKLNLLGKHSWEKFIPELYLHETSIEQRLDLLRGLMDTDGSCKKTGEANFYTTSPYLRDGVIEIVRSLGGNATFRTRDRIEESKEKSNFISKRVSYTINIGLPNKFNPFFLTRKRERFSTKLIENIRIKSIKPIGIKPVQCILVENDEHLYVTDDYIVTHNTIEEKMAPQMLSYESAIVKILGNNWKSIWETAFTRGDIQIIPLEHMRGIDISDAIVICDEAQNMGKSQAKTLITRINETSRLFLLGDIDQIDRNFNDGIVPLEFIAQSDPYFHSSFAIRLELIKVERGRLAAMMADINFPK